MSVERRLCASLLSLALAAAPGLATEARPVTVSPGEIREIAVIDDACPTFNWAAVEGARAYDLVVYAAPFTDGPETSGSGRIRLSPVLQHRVAGAALGWTPSTDRCLQRGGTYGWVIRAVGPEKDGEWSEPRAFRVSNLPTREEVRDALEVLRHYLGRSAAETGGAAVLSGLDARHDATSHLAPAGTGSGPPPPPPPPPITSFYVDHSGGVVASSVRSDYFTGYGAGLTAVNAERLGGRFPSYYTNNTHWHLLPDSVSPFLAGPTLVQTCSGAHGLSSTCTTPACSGVVLGGGCTGIGQGCTGRPAVTSSEPSGLNAWTCTVQCTETGNVSAAGNAICAKTEPNTGGPEE